MNGRAWRFWVAAVLAVAAVAAGGCRRTRVVDAGQMQRYVAHVVRLAARDTGCPEGQLAPMQIATEPPVFTVTGCGNPPVEYWLNCGRRRCSWRNVPRLQETASPALACAPDGILLQPTQVPNVRYATGCGRIAPFTIACNGAACQWAMNGPVQQGAPVAAPPPPQAPPATAVVVAPQPGAPPTVIQSQVEAQREAILSCIDSGSLTLRVRWTAEGQVLVQLPADMAGPAAEGCIQAVLGGLRVTAHAAGEVVVPVH